MKKLTGFVFALSIAFMSLTGQAMELSDLKPDGITVTHGKYIPSKADISTTRLSLRWNWNRNLLESSSWKLGGYFDLGYSRWRSHLSEKDQPSPNGADKAWAASFTPVFRLEPESSAMLVPFLDVGVGVSYQSEKDLEKKLKSPINMGGHTQFEIRTVVGARFGDQKQFEFSYGWFHYSNANIHSQNEGLDFQLLSFGWNW
ncbi:acyloxyacyl hydrolase [Sansalvadorimonas sp. 2012CJ34-2]|uniref:Acyloxyacyl hydrolase n=1 Tax=Parendozoicomonas callyspongiae TaxID=2942213 RepID=A0ABT0PHG8_9GAMM|nr:acyloxyacyl hydrolase [Sansalvadorimonas sp. 2012CJ34-2]MCL6270775.1 acyloxyacyl hydrolase [Sansalvadorimonas sp. 2012CJ34-2]